MAPKPNTLPNTGIQPPTDLAQVMPDVDKNQILQLLQSIPGIFPRLISGEGAGKEDAAQALSTLASNPALFPAITAYLSDAYAPMRGGEPGPSSHPRGPPPNLSQLQVAMQTAIAAGPPGQGGDGSEQDEGGDAPTGPPTKSATSTDGKRSRSRAATGSEEWQRQRKDNHKEVERRRRGNINEGIDELGRIVPNGSGEKAKGAILSRAVQYIHHLKDNEARNIEKWTLEKLLMDQATGDLQNQLEEVRKAWEEERIARQRAEAELAVLRDRTPKGTNGVNLEEL